MMTQRLKTITFFLLLISIAGLLSWHSIRHMNRVYKPIKVGVSAGPQAEIMKLVQTLVEKNGIRLQIVIFKDYSKLNEALYEGDIQINSFQNQPYLNKVNTDRRYDLSPIGKTGRPYPYSWHPYSRFRLRKAPHSDRCDSVSPC